MNQIDKVIFINLAKRTDRLAVLEGELSRMNIQAERFEAIEHEYGLIGCLESHLEVLKLAKKRGYKNILILEDDIEFLVTPEEFYKELTQFFSSKVSYDVVMLGYNIQKSSPMNSQLLKIQSASTASAYLVSRSIYDQLISLYTRSLVMFRKTRDNWYANDKIWRELQPYTKWFAFQKRLVKQRAGFSDTTGRIEDYDC
jgi:glycosyl transferase family 25